MTKFTQYYDLLRQRGRPLSEIRTGGDGFALRIEDAQAAIEIIRTIDMPILGGDIMSDDKEGGLIYAYQLWGDKYHTLNWYCDKVNGEDRASYCQRSYEISKRSIAEAAEVASELGMTCYIVICM